MASTGWTTCGTGGNTEDDDFSGTSWSNSGNITTDDSSNATISVPNTSRGLFASNFGFSIDAGATITGVQVRSTIIFSGAGASASWQYNRLVIASAVGEDTSNDGGGSVPTSETVVTLGSDSDTWGESLTASICNATGFGWALSITSGGMFGTTSVDFMEMNVHYTAGASGQPASKRMQFIKHSGHTSISRVFQP